MHEVVPKPLFHRHEAGGEEAKVALSNYTTQMTTENLSPLARSTQPTAFRRFRACEKNNRVRSRPVCRAVVRDSSCQRATTLEGTVY